MSDAGPPGAPPKMDFPDAYRELLKALWYANEVYREHGDRGRKGAQIACQAVARFLAVLHENPELAAPFFGVYSALGDLEQGITNELLVRGPVDNPRSRSSVKKHLQVMASASLEVLVEVGVPLEEAAPLVGRSVDKWPGKGSQQIDGKTIRNWRDRLRADRGKDRDAFERIRKHLMDLPDPKQEVLLLLRKGPPGVPKS